MLHNIRSIGTCVFLMFALACAGQQMNLGPHNIGGRGCAACHIPTGDAAVQPLWADASEAVILEPIAEDGWSHSARCLSCHAYVHVQVMDLDAVGPDTQPSPIGPHPVNARYSTNEPRLFPVRLLAGEWQFIANPENAFTKLKLFSRSASDATPTVQCATCHDPHDYSNPHFLRDACDGFSQGTRFCRTCHAEQSNFQRWQ